MKNVISLSLHNYTVCKISVSYMKFFISVVFKLSPATSWIFQRDFWVSASTFPYKETYKIILNVVISFLLIFPSYSWSLKSRIQVFLNMRKYFIFSSKIYFKIFYVIFTSEKVHFTLQGLSENLDLTTRVPKKLIVWRLLLHLFT